MIINSFKFKDRLTCPNCKKEIINKEQTIISNCPFCSYHIFEVMWMQEEDINYIHNELNIGKLYEKGNSLLQSGKYQEAIVCYNEALTINSEQADIWCNAGVAFENLKQYESAIYCYDKALSINIEDINALMNKGNVLGFYLDKPDEAIKYFDKAISINSENGKVWFNKGYVLIKFNQKNEGIECLKKADSLGISQAKQILKKLNLE